MWLTSILTSSRVTLGVVRALCWTILVLSVGAAPLVAQTDTSRHHVRFVSVAPEVRLEVLDWGGSGPPMMLLAGLGNTAHDYDGFAERLATVGHVYGITRRGIGASSHPNAGYGADTLGDDVLAVLDSLRLQKPLLIGSSLAGEELSSVGSRQPTRVAGLVYLDAGYYYAIYDSIRGNLGLEMLDLARKLDRLDKGPFTDAREMSALGRRVADTDLPRLERNLRAWVRMLDSSGATVILPRR
jgi:non-heme chloroperoxidase